MSAEAAAARCRDLGAGHVRLVNSSDLRSRKRVMSSAAANCGGAPNSTTANVNAGRRRR